MIRHVLRSFAQFNSTMNHLNWINLMISFLIKRLDRYRQHAISSSIDDLTILLISQQNLLWSRISITKWWNNELTQRDKKKRFCLESWYTDIYTIRLTSSSITLTLANSIRKDFFVESKALTLYCLTDKLAVLAMRLKYYNIKIL
jgi:hypothetical protein